MELDDDGKKVHDGKTWIRPTFSLSQSLNDHLSAYLWVEHVLTPREEVDSCFERNIDYAVQNCTRE